MRENALEKFSQKIHHDGNPKAVFADLEKFKKSVENGFVPNRGPLLLVGPGTQFGVFSGGGVRALKKLGYTNAFKTLVGVSTGSPVVSYFASQQPEPGTEIYIGPNTGNEFINFKRALRGLGSLVDLDWLCNKNFRQGDRKLNIERMRKNIADIYYAVTRADNAKGVFVNAKKLDDPIEGLRASCAIPEMYLNEVKLTSEELGENVRVVDGGVASPMPIIQSVDKFEPTSILIFANRPKIYRDTLVDIIERKYESMAVSDRAIADAILKSEDEFWKNVEALKDLKIPYTIVWADDSIKSTEKDGEKLKNAADNFEKYILDMAVQ